MSLFIVLEGALRLEDFRFVILALLTLCLRCGGGLGEDGLFRLRLPAPRNFLIIFCVVSITCSDRMSSICPGLAAISVMTFAPVRKASRPTDLALLHRTGRTFLHSPLGKLPIPCPRCMNGGTEYMGSDTRVTAPSSACLTYIILS